MRGGRPADTKDEYHVATADRADAPIYDILIAERGDIPADARHTAEQTRQTAAKVLNWNSSARDERPTASTVASGAGAAGPETEHAAQPHSAHDRS